MPPFESVAWHWKIYARSYAMFDLHPPPTPRRTLYWMTVFGTAVYCGVAAVLFVTINLVTLPFGVFSEPIWWSKATFRILRLPNGIPVLPFSALIVLACATYRTFMERGFLIAVGAWLFSGVLSAVLIAGSIAYNRVSAKIGRFQPPATHD